MRVSVCVCVSVEITHFIAHLTSSWIVQGREMQAHTPERHLFC